MTEAVVETGVCEGARPAAECVDERRQARVLEVEGRPFVLGPLRVARLLHLSDTGLAVPAPGDRGREHSDQRSGLGVGGVEDARLRVAAVGELVLSGKEGIESLKRDGLSC